MTAARRRFSTCRCCGGLAASAFCDQCGAYHVQRAALVQAVILALWGSAGLTRYQTEMQAQRLSARRARPRRTARSRGTSPS